MQITIANVKTTMSPINPSTDTNSVTQKVLSAFSDCESWFYDDVNDILYVTRPNPTITATGLGEVTSIDYTMG